MNNLAIVSANANTLSLVPTPAPAPPPPPATTPVKGRSFVSVYEEVMQRADSMLPDRVVHVADLRFTNEGHIALPGGAEYRLNDWSRKQLASLVGVRWNKWFSTATPAERADELSRRLARTPNELKISAFRDDTDEADGIARAFLAPTFTPISDARIFERMATIMKGLVEEYRFSNVTFTDSTTHYTAVHAEAFDLDGDLLHPGWYLRNSEVGGSALSLDDSWLRLACLNGLLVKVSKRSLYRTHRAIEDDALAAALVIAIGRLPARWAVSFEWMRTAKRITVPHPDDAVAAILSDSAEVPKALVEEAQRVVLRDGDFSRFGIVQSITATAHQSNKDPDVRFAMERLAGEYLAATPAEAA